MEYLVESALLTHGLKSVSNETIKKEWQDPGKKITWIDHGEIKRYAGPESNDRLADIARSEGDRNRKKLLYRLCILWRKS